ncbi:DUF3800 domain-containing protein [Luteibacter yeojuensis]|uniref:DUF3800 domain-containing protein n=1 Tax=Luteibacter yeojuensis TaxID=345309 RepID=UPI0006974A9B|nr:DUF3800 domain-containing protein [Luteibacter yeojuensis]
MHICYIDEGGCPGVLPSATSDIQPALIVAGLIVPHEQVARITEHFLRLKLEFNPKLCEQGCRHWLDLAKVEIKGSELRRGIRKGNRNRQRAVFTFLDRIIALLIDSGARLIACVYIKKPGGEFDGNSVYNAAIQSISAGFERYLDEYAGIGALIADSRSASQNSSVSHSIFTQKFRHGGDAYGHIVEVPAFGHSENHAALQITDFLVSAILMPMATVTYCAGHVDNVHMHPRDRLILSHYAKPLHALLYSSSAEGEPHDGITVRDAIANRSAAQLHTIARVAGPFAQDDSVSDKCLQAV